MSLGTSGYGWGAAVDVVPQADVILAVGTRLAYPGNAVPGASQTVIDLNIDPIKSPRGDADTLAIAADAQVGLASLSSALGGGGAVSEWNQGELDEVRSRARDRIAEVAPDQLALVDAVRTGVPEDGIVIAGVTIMAAWANVCLPMDEPRSFITPSYMGTLGYAFPRRWEQRLGTRTGP